MSLALLTGILHVQVSSAEERTIGVFVALCDNVHQGIVPMPKAIGNGDDPDRNLYWGNAEGLLGVFDKSPHWSKQPSVEPAFEDVLRQRAYSHASGQAVLHAFAYRGSAIEQCLKDYELAVHQGTYDLVVFLGHNGLMDFSLGLPKRKPSHTKTPDCIVLCCKSEVFFRERIEAMGARPILLTTQLMYPGAFILRDVLDEWMKKTGLNAYRLAAGRAYPANQKISQKAALGVFADLQGKQARTEPPALGIGAQVRVQLQ